MRLSQSLFIIIICVQNLVAQDYETSVTEAFNNAQDFHYIRKDSAYFYYEKVIKLADEEGDMETLLYGLLYLINTNGHFYDVKNYKKNIEREEKVLKFDVRTNTLSNKGFFEDYLLFDKGNYYYKTQQYILSKKYFLQLQAKINAIPKNKQTIDNIDTLTGINSFLGLIYTHTGKYELATYTYIKDIALLESHKDSLIGWESSVFNTKKLLAKVYEINNNAEKANALLKEALVFYREMVNDESYKNNFITTYMFLASNYITLGKPTEALKTLDENSSYYTTNNPFKKEINEIYGDVYLALNKFELSEKSYSKNLQETLAYVQQKKHPAIAKSYLNLGRLYTKKREFEKSLTHFQTALQQLGINFNSNNLGDNPNPKNSAAKLVLLEVLKEKLETLLKAHLHTNKLVYLENAHGVSKVIVQTLDALRPEFDSKLDKQFLLTQAYPSLQKTVEVSYTLFQITKNQKYIEDAFYFIEKSKSILLLEAHRNSEANTYGGVPATITAQAHEFKTKIVRVEKEIFESTLKDINLLDSLYILKQRYTNWQLSVEKEHPKYYDLKFNTAVIDLKIIQKKLQKNQAVLNYMVVPNKMYVVLIDVDGYHFEELPFLDKNKNTIEKLYRKSAKIDVNDSSIFTDSYQVFKTILAPVLSKTKATDLIVIPDDVLSYISFDGLQTSEVKNSYLIHSHVISYASSATLWQANSIKRNTTEHKLLVFAPKFSQNDTEASSVRAELYPLKYNQQEADKIGSYFSSTIFKDTTATIANFKNQVGKHSMLHFATHASANDEFPDYSYLAFSNTTDSADFMFVKDIYSYIISADLVTLSACQTGIGKLQKGEGMASLARAFQYAGASAIVTTLWKIDDQSTSEIMNYFYRNLKNGLNKKEALRHAKLTYLENTEDPILQHPYFWSGIILTGNTDSVIETNYLLHWGIIGILLFLLVVWLFRKHYVSSTSV